MMISSSLKEKGGHPWLEAGCPILYVTSQFERKSWTSGLVACSGVDSVRIKARALQTRPTTSLLPRINSFSSFEKRSGVTSLCE